jgi:23S rRNA pseudouridine1911/1915/1917 synthase
MNEWSVSLPQRLDAFLASEGRMLSRAKAQKAIEEGYVRVNGVAQRKPAWKVDAGDVVSLQEMPEATSSIEAVDLKLPILYEDSSCFVLNKPAGYAVHPGSGMAAGEKTLLHGLAFLFRERSLPFYSASVLVHRLDKETTGCILIAKNAEAHLQLQKQFETRSVEKKYLALVAGIPEHDTAKIDAPIGRSSHNRTKMSVRGVSKSREAQTTYQLLDSSKEAALVECDLHTGRTHQVRVHLQSIGHPVLGDPSYTNGPSEKLAEKYNIEQLCLHAWKLTFESPADGKKHTIVAEPSVEFQKTLELLEMQKPMETKKTNKSKKKNSKS